VRTRGRKALRPPYSTVAHTADAAFAHAKHRYLPPADTGGVPSGSAAATCALPRRPLRHCASLRALAFAACLMAFITISTICCTPPIPSPLLDQHTRRAFAAVATRWRDGRRVPHASGDLFCLILGLGIKRFALITGVRTVLHLLTWWSHLAHSQYFASFLCGGLVYAALRHLLPYLPALPTFFLLPCCSC